MRRTFLISLLGVMLCTCVGPSRGANEGAAVSSHTPVDLRVETLLAPPSSEDFEVVFEYTSGAPGRGPARFVWRQRDGVRRWDEILKLGARSGQALIQDQFESGRAVFPNRGRGCDWYWYPAEEQPSVLCHGDMGSNGLPNALAFSMFSRPYQQVAGKTILNRSADCFAFQLFQGDATLCVDSATHVPLLFDGRDAETVRHHIEAIAVNDRPAPLHSVLDDLSRPDLRGSVPSLEALGLPDAILSSVASH